MAGSRRQPLRGQPRLSIRFVTRSPPCLSNRISKSGIGRCFAVAILSGTRDDAIASMAVRHVDVTRRSVFHDARVVRTKNRKTFMSTFFPVGEDMQAIVAEWISFLAKERMFGPDDPLFPATIQTGHGDEAAICRQADRLLVWQLGSFLQRSELYARRRSRFRSRRTMRSRVV